MAWNVRGVCRLLLSAALTAGAAVAAGVNLDQCANGGIGTPRLPCTGAQWQNGNLNANNSQYAEGYATSFRAQLDLPAAGAYTSPLAIVGVANLAKFGSVSPGFMPLFQISLARLEASYACSTAGTVGSK